MKGFGAKPDKKVKPIKVDLMDIPNFKGKLLIMWKMQILARSVYKENDKRFLIKQEINARYNSGIREEKGYSFDFKIDQSNNYIYHN